MTTSLMKLVLEQTLNPRVFQVLLIEDNLAEAELIQELLLTTEGVRASLAHVKCVSEAIDALHHKDFDVILLDLSLPDGKWLDTITRLQEYLDQSNTSACPPIVVLSAIDEEKFALEAIHAGAQDYLVKGKFNSELLIRSLRYVIERQVTTEALQRIEEQYCSVVDNVKDVIFQTDATFNWTFMNPAWTKITGFSIAESLGTPVLNYVHPEDRQRHLEQCHLLIEGKKDDCRYEIRYLTQAGGFRWVELDARLTFARNGTISGITGMLHDITEQKLAQDALCQSERRLRCYFENSLVGMVIITPDKSLIEVNEALCNLLGYSKTELMQKNWTEWTHPDDLELELEQLFRIFAGESDGYVLDKRFIRKDGQVVYTRISVRCVRRENGACDHLIAGVLDLSDRYPSKQQQKASEVCLNPIINSIPEPIANIALQQQLVGSMQECIRRTLKLQDVLTTAVKEVRQFLQTDRTVIYRFYPNWSGVIEAESVGEGWMRLLGLEIQDHCFTQCYVSLYQEGYIRAIDDIYTAGLGQSHLNLLSKFEVKANLVVPLFQGENLWGLLIAHHCRSSREWQSFEIEALRQVSVQLAIAIQQSMLFEQAKAEIADRKQAIAALRLSEERKRSKAQQLEVALHELKNAQTQLVQSEKMASLGQRVADIAHEINHPVSYIYQNVTLTLEYTFSLLQLISLYQQHYPTPATEIQDKIAAIELDFIQEDFPKLLQSMQQKVERIQEIVQSLRNVSHLD